MKKTITLLLMIAMIFSLCACSSKTVFESKDSTDNNLTETKESSSVGIGKNLEMLCRKDDNGCYTNDGYYYLTEEAVELPDGEYASHLMYMDFKTQQEIYLCSNTGCNHNTADCSSVFLTDDFPTFSTLIFIYNSKLYILSKEMDTTGEIATDHLFFDNNSNTESESQPTVLYRANLDGTNREKYTFDAALTLEDFVIGDENGIYVITKKLSSEQHGASSFSTSSERNQLLDYTISDSVQSPTSNTPGTSIDGEMFADSSDFAPKFEGSNPLTKIEVEVKPMMIVGMFGVGFLIICAAVVLAAAPVLRMKPREILSKMS